MSLDPDCLAQLKLRQQPFDAVPSEDFLYSDPLLESLIETASRALQAAESIVVLAGAEGSGRSVQLMRLLGSLDDSLELIAFRGRAEIGFETIDATIRSHLGQDGLEAPDLPLAQCLIDVARSGSPLVLAIDDAHLIGSDSISRLLRIRAEILEAGVSGLRLILVGDQSFGRGNLPLPDPMDDAQVVRLNMRPFNLEQAGAYLRHRLRVAGIDDPETFLSSGDIAVLQTNSKGLPFALNRNANAWLAKRCRAGGPPARAVAQLAAPAKPPSGKPRSGEPPPATSDSRPEPEEALPEGILDFDLEPDTYRPSSAPPRDPQLAQYLVGEDARDETPDFEHILKHVRQHQLEQAAPPPTVATEPRRQAAPVAAKAPLWSRPWLIPAILAVVVVAILVPVALQLDWSGSSSDKPPALVPSTGEDPAARAPQPLQDAKPPPAPAAPDETEAAAEADQAQGQDVEPAAAPASRDAHPASDETPASEAAEPLRESATPPENAESQPDSLSEDLAWLMRQDAERFTVQLVAARDLETARSFMGPHEVGGVHFVETRSYVIALVGSFPSRAIAAAAIADLPEGVRENGPWIRTIGSIRSSLP